MKAVSFSSFGKASEVARLVDVAEPGDPAPGEVAFLLEAGPINPSDLLHFAGLYGERAVLPSFAGSGVVGRVIAQGPGVKHPRVGDRVVIVNTQRNAWRERFNWPAADAVVLPEGDATDLALLAANPPTAWLMLERIRTLEPGDWVIQNAANSSVGTSLIQIAAARGIRTVNVVRRADVVDSLRALGGDVVLVDGPGLVADVAAATRGGRLVLGIDAIGGEATQKLGSTLSAGGVVVNYGRLGGEPCRMDPGDVIFRDVSLRGFWYSAWWKDASNDARQSLFRELITLHRAGKLRVPVEAVYPVDQLGVALAHAERAGRNGKVVLRWA